VAPQPRASVPASWGEASDPTAGGRRRTGEVDRLSRSVDQDAAPEAEDLEHRRECGSVDDDGATCRQLLDDGLYVRILAVPDEECLDR
jgi:hypothetical protein